MDLDDDVTLNVLVDGRELVDHKDIDADQLGGGTLVSNGLQRRGGRGRAFLRGTIFNAIPPVIVTQGAEHILGNAVLHQTLSVTVVDVDTLELKQNTLIVGSLLEEDVQVVDANGDHFGVLGLWLGSRGVEFVEEGLSLFENEFEATDVDVGLHGDVFLEQQEVLLVDVLEGFLLMEELLLLLLSLSLLGVDLLAGEGAASIVDNAVEGAVLRVDLGVGFGDAVGIGVLVRDGHRGQEDLLPVHDVLVLVGRDVENDLVHVDIDLHGSNGALVGSNVEVGVHSDVEGIDEVVAILDLLRAQGVEVGELSVHTDTGADDVHGVDIIDLVHGDDSRQITLDGLGDDIDFSEPGDDR